MGKPEEVLKDKSMKAKQKVERLSALLLEGELSMVQLIAVFEEANEKDQAVCMEALERLSQTRPEDIPNTAFELAVSSLTKKHPGLKRESARVIANSAHLHTDKLDKAIVNLLNNTEHQGTVVRWSAALALSTIVQLDFKGKAELVEAIRVLERNEEKNGIRKIYQKGLKNQG
ncbi:hypothetical protein [Halocola ammonii]